MEQKLKRKDFQSFNSSSIIFKSSNANFYFQQISISFPMQFFSSKYDNSNLELLLSLWKQVTQDKSQVSFGIGLPIFHKNYKIKYEMPYSKYTLLKELCIRTILIRDIFNAYCKFIFDPGGRHVDLNK